MTSREWKESQVSRIKGRRPSAGLVVAVVALIAALAGTAVGGVAVTSLNKEDKTQVKKIAKKQARKQIKKLAAAPFAYAKIDGGTGDVDAAFPSRRINSSQVSKAGGGVYCLNLSFTPTTATAIPTGGDDAAMIGLAPQIGSCPANTDLLVRTWDFGAGALADESFLVQVGK